MTKVNPEMLIFARELRSMTQQELANKSEVSQTKVSKYENGISEIEGNDLEQIALALDFPVSFFYREGKRRGIAPSQIFHRARKTTSVKDLRRIDRELDLFSFNVNDLLCNLEIEAVYPIPELDIEDYGSIDEIAAAVRALWELGPGPIPNLMSVVEDAGCFVRLVDFGTKRIDEAVQWISNEVPVILLNDRAPGDRMRFTLAHALGHLVMHRFAEPHPKREEEADRFAAALLMPYDDMRADLKPVTLPHLYTLKPYYKVSVQALVYRARELGIIDERRYKSLYQQISRGGQRTNEYYPVAKEKPVLMDEIINIYRKKLGYSPEEIANGILDITVDEYASRYEPSERIRIVPKFNNKSDNANVS